MEIRRIEDKCNLCMLCVQECVSGVIREVNGAPAIVDPLACNRCSHCVAVCPKNALEHDALDPAQVRRVKKKLLDPRVFEEIIRTRRSVRHYKDEAIPKETLERVFDLARHSPTASNSQNVEYVVVTDKALIRETAARLFSYGVRFAGWTRSPVGSKVYGALNALIPKLPLDRYVDGMAYYEEQAAKGRDLILHNAPVLILVCAPARASFACDNCNIAAANITNYAHSLGLGTCYIGFLTLALRLNPGLRRKLEIPKGKKVFASLVMGRPAHGFASAASRKKPAVHWVDAR